MRPLKYVLLPDVYNNLYHTPFHHPDIFTKIHATGKLSYTYKICIFIISSFNGDLCNRHSNVCTGLTFAKSPNFLRIANRPCSGRTLALGSLSKRGSPTAANNTASAHLHILNVSSGNGSPTKSIACAPHIAS